MDKSKSTSKRDRSLKRVRTKVSFPYLLTINIQKPENYLRFLVLESVYKSKPFSSQSVLLVFKFFEGTIGKKLRTGEVFVEDKAQQQAKNVLTQTRLADLDISVKPHRRLNSSQGVISKQDLLSETEAHLLEGLKVQDITGVTRVTISRDTVEILTNHIFLTFNRSKLPEHVNAGFCEVWSPSVPN